MTSTDSPHYFIIAVALAYAGSGTGCTASSPLGDKTSGSSLTSKCAVDEYDAGEANWDCEGNYAFNGVEQGEAVHLGHMAPDDLGSEASSELEGDALSEIRVSVADDGSIELETLVDDDYGRVELSPGDDADEVVLYTSGNTGEVQLACPGLAQFAEDLQDPSYDASETCDGGTEDTNEEIGCFRCTEVGAYLAEDTVYLGMMKSSSLEKVGRMHMLVDQHVAIRRDLASSGQGVETLVTMLVLASIFRVSYDSENFHAEFGESVSDDWNSDYTGDEATEE